MNHIPPDQADLPVDSVEQPPENQPTCWAKQPARQVLTDPGFERSGPKSGEDCHNCGTALLGAYCHVCGQPARSLIRNLPMMLWQWLGDAMDLDSRLFRTLGPLFFQPGRLSMEYVAGRRHSFVQPLRLYLVISLVFFLALQFTTVVQINQNENDLSLSKQTRSDQSQTEGQELDPSSIDLPSEQPDLPEADTKPELADQPIADQPIADQIKFMDDQPWSEWQPADKPLPLPGLSLEDQQEASVLFKQKGDKLIALIEEDPTQLLDVLYSMLPQALFLLLPLAALILKMVYFYKKRFYIEHLLFALHNHSFLFIALLALFVLDPMGEFFARHDFNWLEWLLDLAKISLLIWMPVYLYLAQKRFYGQGFILTGFHYILVGLIYQILLIFTLISAFVVGVVFL